MPLRNWWEVGHCDGRAGAGKVRVVLAKQCVTNDVTFRHSSAVTRCPLTVLGGPFTRGKSSGDLFHSFRKTLHVRKTKQNQRPCMQKFLLTGLALSVFKLRDGPSRLVAEALAW